MSKSIDELAIDTVFYAQFRLPDSVDTLSNHDLNQINYFAIDLFKAGYEKCRELEVNGLKEVQACLDIQYYRLKKENEIMKTALLRVQVRTENREDLQAISEICNESIDKVKTLREGKAE